jgi:hypothetical protein
VPTSNSFTIKLLQRSIPYRVIWELDIYALEIRVLWLQLDLQVSSMERIANLLSEIFSAVVHLKLEHYVPGRLPGEVDRTQWRRLLGPFSNVKTLGQWDRQGSFSLSAIGRWRAPFKGITRTEGAHILWERRYW